MKLGIEVITTGNGYHKAGVKGVVTGIDSKAVYIEGKRTVMAIFDVEFEGGSKHGDMQIERDFVLLDSDEGRKIPAFVPPAPQPKRQPRKGWLNYKR